MNAFHLALPVRNLEAMRKFYSEVIGAEERRSAFNWIDFDFFGHQISLHLVQNGEPDPECTIIDGDRVPARHFGLVVHKDEWKRLKLRFESAGQQFTLGPRMRFEGQPAEQGTLFITDPEGNYLEFKYFSDSSGGLWF